MTIGVGIIGYGFMGRAHAAAYGRAQQAGCGCALRAVCDVRRAQPAGAQEPAAGNIDAGMAGALAPDVAWHDCAESLLADPSIDLVSICTPTDSHVALAEQALRAGKHALVEKPVALEAGAVRLLAETAREAGRLCMPAMCMRFWPGWDWLKAAVDDGRYGAVRSAAFQRLGSRPGWAREFYADEARSGGAIFDLHVHDVDVVHWLFGRPRAVTTRGDSQHCTTLYDFDGPKHVTAEAAWDNPPGFGFRMRFTVVLERATVDFDIGRPERLIVSEQAESAPVALADLTGYDGEIRALLGAIEEGAATPPATLEEAAEVIETIGAERTSALERTTVVLAGVSE